MRKIILLFFLPLTCFSQSVREDFKSGKTNDTYEIIIRKPIGFDSAKAYHIIYFTDATINSGKTILSQKDEIIKNCILIGIGHKGDWSSKRQRDFIPSDAGGYNNKDFGQASKFFSFMKEELMPYINKKFSKQKSKIFIGHSFGGLIALYMSLRENELFDHYYAISPSVWANYGELIKIEKNYSATHKEYTSGISIYAGSLEVFNKVLSSSKVYYNTVKERNYKGLSISHTVVSGVNHYGIVPKIIPEVFKQFK
jgi:predicted alpha/beta superfamily hydrolase